jgi:CRISPR-associated endonuclease/helicase Cas3
LLRDLSSRIFDKIEKIAKRQPKATAWLVDDDGSVEVLKLQDLAQKNRKERINYKTVLLPPSAGGLNKGGFLDGSSPEVANDVSDEWKDEEGRQRRLRLWDNDPEFNDKKKGMRLIRRIVFTAAEDEIAEGDTGNKAVWCWYELPKSADNEISETALKEIKWQDHIDDIVYHAMRIVDGLDLEPEIQNAVVLAAKFHDLGKKGDLFQWIIGNSNLDIPLAKSDRKYARSLRPHYRHEFSSLVDLNRGDPAAVPEFSRLSNDMKELVLHLVAAHHGRARPHFSPDEAFDPKSTEKESADIAAAVPGRFARLQRKYGRWGLAYLESLLRAADYAASANPSDESEAS